VSIQFDPVPLRSPRRGNDRAVIVAVLLAGLVAVAIVKPWQGPTPAGALIAAPPAPSSPPSSARATSPASPPSPSPTVTLAGATVHITGLGRATSPEFELSGTVEMRVSTCSSNGVTPFVWVYDEAHATVALVTQRLSEIRNLARRTYYVTTSANADCAWTIDFSPSAAVTVASPPSSPAPRQLACGQFPSLPSPPAAAPTPQVAGGSPESTLVVAVVGVWPSCFHPDVVRIKTGGVVQWQLIALPDVDIMLDSGVAIGLVLHDLEVRFNRPGTYAYHAGRNPSARGTIIVEGARQPGPALEIWSPAGHRVVDSIA
jgi:hypothetical protein